MIGFSANEIFFNFGKKNPIQIYFRPFMQIKCLGEYVCAVLLSHSFPLCPSLGNGAGTERLPLNLLLGKKFSNRKRRFHRIRFGFLELFPGEEFFNWKCRFHRNREVFWFCWECMTAGICRRDQGAHCPAMLGFSLHQDRKLWETGKAGQSSLARWTRGLSS